MDRSESIKELASALSKAQGEMVNAEKSTTNAFFKSKYADLASVVEAIRVPLAKHGIAYVQLSHDSEHAASIETIIMHSSGEWISTGKTTVPVSKVDAQGFGSAMTYARRYSLSAAFGVAPEEDDGNAAAKAKPIQESGKSIGQTEFEKLTEDRKRMIADLHVEISDTFRDMGEVAAYDMYCQTKANLPLIEEQAALRGLLSSKIKTSFQRLAAIQKSSPTQTDYANTP